MVCWSFFFVKDRVFGVKSKNSAYPRSHRFSCLLFPKKITLCFIYKSIIYGSMIYKFWSKGEIHVEVLFIQSVMPLDTELLYSTISWKCSPNTLSAFFIFVNNQPGVIVCIYFWILLMYVFIPLRMPYSSLL